MINPTSISTKNVFHQMQGSFRSIFGLISSLFYVFATQPRFLSSVQLLVNHELFHQSSFYLKNIVSSIQLLFKQRYLHFSLGEKSPRGTVLDPLSNQLAYCCYSPRLIDFWLFLCLVFIFGLVFGSDYMQCNPYVAVRWQDIKFSLQIFQTIPIGQNKRLNQERGQVKKEVRLRNRSG